MGNSPSSSESEDDKEINSKEVTNCVMEDCASDSEESGDKDSPTLTDLTGLFNHGSLRDIAAKIKEEIPENVLQQYRFQILRWLEERENKLEDTITISQFCDWLMNKGVSREDAIKAFQQFDTDGSGIVEVNSVLEIVKSLNGTSVMGELGRSIRMLQACSLTPGFVDVYSGDKNAVKQHAERILKYLLRNRSPSLSLPFPYLNGFNNTASMRNSVLKSTFRNIKDTVQRGGQSILGSGEEVRTINPCFNIIEVSSNSGDSYRLTNGDPNTFWQSDGAARSHWIRLHMKNNVIIKSLSIYVASTDSSYMPELITVTAGKNFRNLRDIKDVRIPSHVTGEVMLLNNAKAYYPIIQINIKRCRNDGCDTRIHGLKTVGFKVIKEPGISVGDAAAIWYLQVLATTVTLTMPLAPQMRTTILEHTKKALGHIPPLSLCPASGERPQFLSKFVLQEVEKFVTDIALEDGNVIPDGLQMLLSFNLARGHVGGLLRTLQYFQDNPDLNLPCTDLLYKMLQSRDSCWEKSGHTLQMSLSGTDGGQSDENTIADNILNQAWTSQLAQGAYITEEGKTKVNIVFKSSEYIQLTRIRIKVVSGHRGAKRGLVFVYRDSEPFELAKHVERFETYDTWRKFEYDFSVQIRNAGIAGKPDNPVAYFSFEDDCDEIDVPVSWHPTGQYVLLKLLEPRNEAANKIGIVGVKFYGFARKSVMVEEEIKIKHPPNPEKRPISSSLEIMQSVLQFLVDLAQDQACKKGIPSGRPDFLEFSDTPLELLWSLYNTFRNREEEDWQTCATLTQQLLYCLLPVLSSQSGENKTAAEELFQHLCKTIDDPGTSDDNRHNKLCKQLIIDGAAVFFPDKEARRKQLFNMMQNVEKLSTAPSVMLVFQSLCQFFSSVDPSGLLDLPKIPDENYDTKSVLEIMETMISVTFHEFILTTDTGQNHEQVTHLLKLVSSLQTSLLAWCWSQMSADDNTQTVNEVAKTKAEDITTQYAMFVAGKASEGCDLLLKKDVEVVKKIMENLEMSFLGSVVRQLILILTYLCDFCGSTSRVQLLQNFQPLCQNLQKLSQLLPQVFPSISSDHWANVQTDDIILRTWEVESSHNYENNQHVTQVYNCPGAQKFVVDFDSRCETERRYDYLVFTDSKGVQMRFDQRVGTPKWPKQVTFSGPNLHFLFHSDSSNTEWGYKFKVTARGSPDVPLSWPFDLQLSLTKMLGRLCGATLNANPHAVKDMFVGAEEVADQDMLRSELWTTLFRGGYMIGKLQRSLSGKFAAEESGVVLEFLWEMVNRKEGPATALLEKCKESVKGMKVGGDNVDAAIEAVFTALIWHTQHLREEISKYISADTEHTLTDGVIQAYTSAESLRMPLVGLRQKFSAEEDKNSSSDDDPATICRDKALYLLKFAGLTKVQLKNEMRSKAIKQWKKLSNRKTERQFKFDGSEKHPSFRLVLEFVQDPAWTTERVNRMLQERSNHGKAVSDVYVFSSEFLRISQCPESQTPFQIPVVLFLQEILSYQDGFAKHYAEGLDGCGLDQEAKVRQGYYLLTRRLIEPFHKMHRHQLDKKIVPAYEYIQACLLHLLDMDWQPYDFSFISDVKLPDLFLIIAKETVKMRDCTLGHHEEEQEIKEYEQCMKWFEECSSGFEKWYDNNKREDGSKQEKKAVQMFVARFCDLLDVEISCDGCGVTLPGRRYRCLQCVDMDLCATCYAGGVKPEGEHSDEHDIVHLVFKCNKCQAFIVGMRIHCNECEDFDLCLGCHAKGSFPSGHLATHDVTKFPMVKLKTSQDSDSLIQAYIHQHVWLMFTVLALSMGDIIQNENSQTLIDTDYVKLAAQLQSQCIRTVTHCLQQVPDDAEDSNKEMLQNGERAIETRQEEAFAIHSQERIMGLLGAMVPQDYKASLSNVTYNFTTEVFIQLLFKIARGKSGHEVNTRHLAMGLLGQLLTKCENQVVDQALTNKPPDVGTDVDTGAEPVSGIHTVEYLFSFGADCLEKCGLEWSCSVARILQSLYHSNNWKPVIHDHLTSCVQSLSNSPDLPSIFALFVMAGFPEVLTIGTLVLYCHIGVEQKTGVVLKHFPDKHQTLIIDVKTRKRYTVQDRYVDCISSTMEIWDMDHINIFISTVQNVMDKIRKEEDMTVETIWVLSLSLKVLNNTLKSMTDTSVVNELFESSFIQCLVYIASKGTGFSQQWLLKDLEVLSLMLYTNEGSATSFKKGKTLSYSERLASALEKHTKAKENKDNDVYYSFSSSSSTSSSSLSTTPQSSDDETDLTDINSVFDDLDEKTKVMFEALRSDLKVPLDVLRAIYDMNDKNPDDVVKAVIENLESSPQSAKDDIKRLSQKWASIAQAKSPEAALATAVSDKVIDTGIHYHPSMNQNVRVLEKATEEEAVDVQKLIQTPDNDMEDDILKQHRSKSAELLKRELEKHGKSGSRDYLIKVNMAMSILYARKVLISLLGHWPESGHLINAELLGCKEVQQIPCVLDLLNKTESRDSFQRVVEKVIQHCETDSLVPIASTAGQFMEEVTMSAITRESKHNYTAEDDVTDKKIQLPGASFLRISFDNKCSIEEVDELLVFSTSQDMKQDRHEFTGKSPWSSFQLPGDTLYYKFNVDTDSMFNNWGYKFTVSAGTRDSFETGYAILNKVLTTNLALCLPLSELWQILVYVATKQTGTQRLKAIQLLLKLLLTQHMSPSTPKLTLDLRLLKPLWQLYNNQTKQELDNNTILPPVVRALTELFLQVENVAMEWNVMTEYLLAMQDVDEIRKVVGQGIMNVAAVSIMIGYKNSATELVSLIKKKKDATKS